MIVICPSTVYAFHFSASKPMSQNLWAGGRNLCAEKYHKCSVFSYEVRLDLVKTISLLNLGKLMWKTKISSLTI